MIIAVTGATGQLGQLVIADLKGRISDSQIVALARNPAKAASLGVAVREADYGRPDTLNIALAGVDRLLLISSSEVGQRILQHRNVIEAAKDVGVKHLVYTSLLHADTTPMSLAEEHLATEALIVSSGIPYTILRNGWYSENYAQAATGALAAGSLIGSAGDGKISAASRKDFAEAAAVVLTTPGHDGRIYELAGDEAFSLPDLAREISKQEGRDIPYRDLPEAEYATALQSAGVPEPFAAVLAGADVAISKGALFNDSRQLSELIGHPTTPISRIVAGALN